MSEKIKAIRGNKDRAEEVKQWLKEHGAKEFFDSKCIAEDFLYFVTPDGLVNTMAVKTSYYLFDIEELPHWRANYSEKYYFISDYGKIAIKHDFTNFIDNERYRIGNYFKTQSEAEEACSKIVKLLKESK